MGTQDQWDCPDPQELLVHRVIEVLMVSQGCRGQRDHKVNKEKWDLQESPEEMVMMASQDFRVLQA